MSIAARAASGAAWNLTAGIAVRILGLAGTLALTRFLAPAEYGEVSVAVVTVMMTVRFATLGLGPYIIARRAGASEAFEAFVYHNMFVGAACLAVTAARHPIGEALGSPGMSQYVPGIALAAFLTQVAHVPSATLIRDLHFRVVALTRAAGEVTYTLVSVAFASLLGGATIVAGNLARSLLVSALIFARADWRLWLRLTRPRWETLRRMLGFGLPLTAGGLTQMVTTTGDNLLVANLYGPAIMGEYNLAYNLATIPSGHVAEHMGDVLLPSFAKVSDAQRRAALPRAAMLIALVVFPLSIGLAVVAPSAVAALLDPRWAEVAPMLAILTAVNLPHPLDWVVGAYFASRGRTRPLMVIGLARVALVFGSILTIGRGGPIWACIAVAVAFLFAGTLAPVVGSRLENLPLRPLFGSVARPLVACAFMVAEVLVVRSLLSSVGIPTGWTTLLLETTSGAVAYLLAVAVFAREGGLELLRLVRGLTERRGPQ
jgi:lipopolysaccharide exporter